MVRLFVGLVASSAAAPLTEEYVQSNVHNLWGSFTKEHGRVYASAAEEQRRFEVFEANLLEAVEWQHKNPHAEFGVTQFSDYTDEEFRSRLAFSPSSNRTVEHIFTDEIVASTLAGTPSVDWRDKGAVVPVKDQGDCGGCWAFASAATIESAWAIAGNKLTSLSEQELLACADWFPCTGCGGGEMSCAFQYLTSDAKGKMATEASYPYTAGAAGKEGSCKKGTTAGATVTGQKDIPSNEGQMATWVASHGPIAIGAHADPWKQYKKGILTSCGSGAVDHAIVIVGYGTEAGEDYWLIRNSWGESFGESGYIRIGRGSNVCQVKSQPITAVVASSVTV
jgi:cysteine peptidase B